MKMKTVGKMKIELSEFNFRLFVFSQFMIKKRVISTLGKFSVLIGHNVLISSYENIIQSIFFLF